jgi:hypothetical protein
MAIGDAFDEAERPPHPLGLSEWQQIGEDHRHVFCVRTECPEHRRDYCR